MYFAFTCWKHPSTLQELRKRTTKGFTLMGLNGAWGLWTVYFLSLNWQVSIKDWVGIGKMDREDKKTYTTSCRNTEKSLAVLQWIVSLYMCVFILYTFTQVSSLVLLFLIKNLVAFTISLMWHNILCSPDGNSVGYHRHCSTANANSRLQADGKVKHACYSQTT